MQSMLKAHEDGFKIDSDKTDIFALVEMDANKDFRVRKCKFTYLVDTDGIPKKFIVQAFFRYHL